MTTLAAATLLSAKPGGLQVGEHGEHALVELGRLLDDKTVRGRLLPLLDSVEEVRTVPEGHMEDGTACLPYAKCFCWAPVSCVYEVATAHLGRRPTVSADALL